MVANIQLIEAVARLLTDSELTLVTAESCTGGMIAAELTSVPGSSEWFEGAFVTYRLSAKTRMIGVRQSTLDAEGAIDNIGQDLMHPGGTLPGQDNVLAQLLACSDS